MAEEDLPLSWSLSGGNGASQLYRTVSKSVPGKTDLTCVSGTSVKKTTVAVCKADLIFAGVSETNEETIGGLVVVNEDDDNTNGVADKADAGPVAGEDDLKALLIVFKPLDIGTGTLTLAATSGGSKIRLWSDAGKSNGPVLLPRTWALAGLATNPIPSALYVEGFNVSDSARDVGLRLVYEAGGFSVEDKVKLTVTGLQSPLQYRIGTNSWANIPEPLYVCSNTLVQFRVFEAPSDAPAWSAGKPVWTFEGQPGGSGMATNTHRFLTVSTNAEDLKWVTAECGNTVSGKVIVLSVDFNLMWETANKANQIFNPTPKDDPPEIPRNMLYVVESPADSLYHITLEVNDQPVEMRSKLMHAVYNDGTKLSTGEGFFLSSSPADITFNHPLSSAMFVTDFEIKVGYDLNGNSSLDADEILCPLQVKDTAGTVIGSPTVRGASDVRYVSASLVVDTGVNDVLVPHARRLLQIFRDGGPGGLPTDKQPTSSGTTSFNCFSGSFSEWLTHNSGAGFSSGGAATIPYHQWNVATSLAGLVGESYQITDAAENYYNATVNPIVEAYFMTNPVGHVATFPPSSTNYYDIPHTHESPAWVPTNTVTFDEPLFLNYVNDDVFGSIGRGRLLYHKAKFIVEKKYLLGVEYLDVIQANYMGEVDDLYDFNYEVGGPAGESAIVQIGYGTGSYGRSAGIIYRDHIIFDVLIDDPF